MCFVLFNRIFLIINWFPEEPQSWPLRLDGSKFWRRFVQESWWGSSFDQKSGTWEEFYAFGKTGSYKLFDLAATSIKLRSSSICIACVILPHWNAQANLSSHQLPKISLFSSIDSPNQWSSSLFEQLSCVLVMSSLSWQVQIQNSNCKDMIWDFPVKEQNKEQSRSEDGFSREL